MVVRLPGSNGELAGLLCLSGRSRPLASEDREFIEAVAGHAAMALDNARLFTRVEQANRHWMEIFDAITDFIVVHDQTDKVLRVNRSLAAMIGVTPSELIGVNMRALLALTSESTLYSCPFCRSVDRRLRRIRSSRARPDLSGFNFPGARRLRGKPADHSRTERHHRPPRSRAPVSRTL